MLTLSPELKEKLSTPLKIGDFEVKAVCCNRPIRRYRLVFRAWCAASAGFVMYTEWLTLRVCTT